MAGITADEIVGVMNNLGIDAAALQSVLGSWSLVQHVRVLDAKLVVLREEAAKVAGEYQAQIETLVAERNAAQAAADAAMGGA